MNSLILFYSKGFNLLKNRINNIFHSKELGNKATTKKSGKIQEKRKEKKIVIKALRKMLPFTKIIIVKSKMRRVKIVRRK
jgi:ribosomal protein L13